MDDSSSEHRESVPVFQQRFFSGCGKKRLTKGRGDGGLFPQLNHPINASLLSFATRRRLFRAHHQSSTRPLDQFSRASDNERAEGGYLLVFNLPERRRVTGHAGDGKGQPGKKLLHHAAAECTLK